MENKTSMLEGMGLKFDESMSGFIGIGEKDPQKGVKIGKENSIGCRFDVQIKIADLSKFLKVSDHKAKLTGTITFKPLGCKKTPIKDGCFNLFSLEAETGTRQMVYEFKFKTAKGKTYFFHGHKEIYHDKGELDVVEDMTKLFTTIYQGEDEQSPVYGAGELYFKLIDTPSLLASMKIIGKSTLAKKIIAYTAFYSFAYGKLKNEYLKNLSPFYDTQYENLVLSGFVNTGNGSRPFFLVSGVHEKGCPWGDEESFWDVLLAIGDDNGGYQRYCITDRMLEGLYLDIENGIYHYQGPLYALKEDYSASFTQMNNGAKNLIKCNADFEIKFDAQPNKEMSFPFPVLGKLLKKLSSPIAKELRKTLPSKHKFGMHITPHTVTVRSGKLLIERPGENNQEEVSSEELSIDTNQTFGEAERSIFRSIKEPTLLYGYICGVRPASRAVRIQIHTDTLRDERQYWTKDQLDKLVGSIVSRFASAEMLIEKGTMSRKNLYRKEKRNKDGDLFAKLGEPVIEVNNDHFPTAVFQRRIVLVKDPGGEHCLALEEAMRLIRLKAIDSDREVTVASIRNDQNKFDVLDRVLDETDFNTLAEERFISSGKKTKSDFSIVIKPNFMFAYNKHDRTTFTDPELVGHLARRIRSAGFEKIAVVEAQSTYGEYFDKRSVKEMADYLGYDGKEDYQIIDMTKDAIEKRDLGPHLGNHKVSTAWRDADFRISFAKNKTHTYAFYTLTLKNIYGTLPLANKFKEYHCERDIYHTTIEYLSAFPVHYGLIDAYMSADGPFGIFADPRPNHTHTIIGGSDLVAVDWVGASKMGIDPMISKYMKLAVEAFGKPKIQLIGDASIYRPWLNVPVALTFLAHKVMDANYYIGNMLYSATTQMDETHFKYKSKSIIMWLLRKLTKPIRNMLFVRTLENPSLGNRFLCWLFSKLGH